MLQRTAAALAVFRLWRNLALGGLGGRRWQRRALSVTLSITARMPDLETILKSEYAHQLYHGIRDRIFETKCGHLEPYESYSKRLSEGERIVIHVNSFIWEVTNGGLSQFLSNSSGDYAQDTLQAMRTIGATAAADALEDVRIVIFGGLPIPAVRERRCDILFEWEDQDEERARAFYAKNELGWCESVELAVAIHIRAHKEMFT